MTHHLESVVIGAGVVGLAIGRALTITGREVVVLEAEPAVGMHSSSRNSEVIHAGLYYPDNSLKARLCVRGKELLYSFCDEHHVSYRRIGKLIVAGNTDDRAKLDDIKAQAIRNGVEDIRYLDKDEVRALDPAVECIGALLSPSTGIIDSHGLLLALQAEIETHDGAVVFNHSVRDIRITDQGIEFSVDDEKYRCKELVNSAGLWATELVSSVGAVRGDVPVAQLAKGHYYAYQGKSPFKHLIYPVPSGGGLGIHATNDLSGAVRFGPDVTWIDSVDYDFDDSREADFAAAIRQYFPAFDENKLTPAYTGVRPKLHGPGEPAADFVIRAINIAKGSALVNLFGIESPGLTASLAIADYVRHLLEHA